MRHEKKFFDGVKVGNCTFEGFLNCCFLCYYVIQTWRSGSIVYVSKDFFLFCRANCDFSKDQVLRHLVDFLVRCAIPGGPSVILGGDCSDLCAMDAAGQTDCSLPTAEE